MIHRFVIHRPDMWLVASRASGDDPPLGFEIPGPVRLESIDTGRAMFELVFYVDDTQLSPEQWALLQRSLGDDNTELRGSQVPDRDGCVRRSEESSHGTPD